MKLTEKQKRFCEEYLVDLNGTRAYCAAYSKVKSEAVARTNASRLLTNANIQKYISDLRQQQSKRTGITADTVLKELKKIALADVEVSGKEKIKALELLGKHLGMFSGQTEDPAAVENNLVDVLREGAADEVGETEQETVPADELVG